MYIFAPQNTSKGGAKRWHIF